MPGGRPDGVRRLIALTAAVACTLGLPSAQSGQRPSSQTTFRAGVELVQIDVVVLDKNGRHVRGLTDKDFGLFDRGKRQSVAAFEEVSHERPIVEQAPALPSSVPVDVGTNHTVEANRLVVIVIDDLHIWKGRTDTAKQIARGILERFGREASMAVLFTSGEHSTQVTVDRSKLAAAVETLKGRQSVRRPNQARDDQSTPVLDAEMSGTDALAAIGQAQAVSLQQFQDNMTMVNTLKEASRMMGVGDARRKAFVLVTEGIAKNPTGIFGTMAEPGEKPAGGEAYAAGLPYEVSLGAKPPKTYHDRALVDMMDAMRRSNVATYAIDPRGEVTSQEQALENFGDPTAGEDSAFRWYNPVRMAQDGLATITEASGGFAVTNTDDFLGGIDSIIRDLDHYYLLGFYPADMKGDRFRPVQVKIDGHPEWTVRFRRGYVPEGPPPPKKDQSALVNLSAGVLPKNDLMLRLGATVLPGSGKEARVAFGLEVSGPRAVLEEADGRIRDELTYQVLVVDEKKKNVKSASGLKARVSLSPNTAAGEPPAIAIYQVGDRVELPPGRYQLRVSAQSARLGKGGSVYLDIEVPNYEKAPLAISGLAIGYADGSRVASTAPMLPFAPTLDRVFASSDALRVYFEVASLGEPADAAGTLEILTASGDRQDSIPVRSGSGRADARLSLSALPAGAYILRATVTNNGETASRDVGFAIR